MPKNNFQVAFEAMKARVSCPEPAPEPAVDAALGEAVAPDETEGIIFLSPDLLDKYPDNPFREYTDRRLEELVESIREYGVLSPIVIRPKAGGRYEILAGHNRSNAAKLIPLPEVPCIIRHAGDTEAALIVTQSNLTQRENLLPSEKARAYRIMLESTKNQAENRAEKYSFWHDFSDDYQENQDLCHGDTNEDTRRTV
ncbi:MAG: ParB/RepB/Spo0J family partition protein, partial [Oscillospiraceae bacterium]|nr:ParB/RepB/Spo0J family partition protein [Oscillospiraceae bacterium]